MSVLHDVACLACPNYFAKVVPRRSMLAIFIAEVADDAYTPFLFHLYLIMRQENVNNGAVHFKQAAKKNVFQFATIEVGHLFFDTRFAQCEQGFITHTLIHSMCVTFFMSSYSKRRCCHFYFKNTSTFELTQVKIRQ